MTTVPPPSQSDGFGFEHRPLVAVVEDPAIVEAIVDVYRSAFSKPPWNETEQQIEAISNATACRCRPPGRTGGACT